MNGLVASIMILAMIGVVVVLVAGLFTMLRGKDTSGERTNRLMWWRVYLQAAALGLFALVVILSR